MKVPLKDIAGKVLKQATISDDVYAVGPNPDLLHQAVVYYQANQRLGSHNTLTRGQVSGGGKKPFASVTNPSCFCETFLDITRSSILDKNSLPRSVARIE